MWGPMEISKVTTLIRFTLSENRRGWLSGWWSRRGSVATPLQKSLNQGGPFVFASNNDLLAAHSLLPSFRTKTRLLSAALPDCTNYSRLSHMLLISCTTVPYRLCWPSWVWSSDYKFPCEWFSNIEVISLNLYEWCWILYFDIREFVQRFLKTMVVHLNFWVTPLCPDIILFNSLRIKNCWKCIDRLS